MTKLLQVLRSFWPGSIRRQLILGIALVHAVLMTLFVVDLVYRQQSFLHRQKTALTSGLAVTLGAGTVSQVLTKDLAGLAEQINTLKTFGGFQYAMILDSTGRVLAHSDRRNVGRHVSDPVSLRLLKAEPRTQQLIATESLIDTAAPILANDRVIGWARIGLSGADIAENAASVALDGVLYTLLAIIIGVGLANLLARGLLRGLRNLTHVSNRVREGERDIRADADRMDELGELGRGMNNMLEAITASEQNLRKSNASLAAGITEQKKAEGELRRTRHFLDTIVESVPAMLFVKDAREHRFQLFNRAGEDLLGMSRNELLGKNDHDLFPKEQADFFLAQDRGVLHSGRLLVIEEEPVDTRHKGRRVLRTMKLPINDENGNPQYILGFSEDVTERKRNEEQLRSAEEQLQQAQKMEAIGQLTGGLSHDFNNLLGIVIGNLDLLQTRIVDSHEARELLEEALDASLRGADLNRRLLAFARRQPLQPRNCDLNEVAGSAAKLLSRVLGASVDMSVHAAADLGTVLVDPAQFEAALTNLAVNARDAMPNGGRLTIETQNVMLDGDYAGAHPGVRPGDYVVLEVSDTGTGIAPEVLSRVYEPFFTTKEAGKGTGLGLSMVFGFVKQSGGHINIYSEVGVGTTVRIYLPRVEGSSEEAEIAASAPLRRGNETILAVEDNESLRRTLVKQLIELGYTVLEADNGHQALAMIAGEPSIDLLLTDIVMPGGLDGWELARQAGEIRPDLKLLFTSGFPEASFARGPAIPADARLLGKPYRKTDLAEKVREALAA